MGAWYRRGGFDISSFLSIVFGVILGSCRRRGGGAFTACFFAGTKRCGKGTRFKNLVFRRPGPLLRRMAGVWYRLGGCDITGSFFLFLRSIVFDIILGSSSTGRRGGGGVASSPALRQKSAPSISNSKSSSSSSRNAVVGSRSASAAPNAAAALGLRRVVVALVRGPATFFGVGPRTLTHR